MGTEAPVRPSVLVAPPPGLSEAVARGAGRTLQHLPDELLRAMVRGLRAHADELAPGALFRRHSSGGCAVGITLRELAPEAFDFSLLRFWLWQRWRRGVERDVARRFPRIKHLQWQFDGAVADLERAGRPQPAKAVGLWLADSAEAELRCRASAIGELHTRTPRRAHRRIARPVRARDQAAEANRAQSNSESRQWS